MKIKILTIDLIGLKWVIKQLFSFRYLFRQKINKKKQEIRERKEKLARR